MTADTALTDIAARFVYVADSGDVWTIPKNETGTIEGDCEDFSLALAWSLANRKLGRFWLDILLFRTVIWFCRTGEGVGHAVLWRRGQGWADNIYPSWRKKTPHRLRFPYILPLLALKLLLGRLR